jgi:hypothetical protein
MKRVYTTPVENRYETHTNTFGNLCGRGNRKRNAYYGIEIDCNDLERYVRDDEKKEFEKFIK